MSCEYFDLQPPSPDSDSCSFTSSSDHTLDHYSDSQTRSNMSSPESTCSSNNRASQPYLLVPNLHITDPSAREVDLGSYPWMIATVIEDDDLTFGGKPLSAWYEEDRRRLSTSGNDEEERRGRQRERVRVDSTHHHHHNQQHHQHHHQQMGKMIKDAKQ